jgi:hypothetical protein
MYMKLVLSGFCLVFILMTVTVSASLEDCPTCGFDYDDEGLVDTNPYTGCPTCVFAYDENGLVDTNPYAGCPTCVFAYYSNGTLIPNTQTGCISCALSSGTTNTLGVCSSCGISSAVSTSANLYRFPDGSAVLYDDGRYLITDKSGNQYYSYGLPDKDGPYGYFADGTPIPYGYWNQEPVVANVQVPVKVQHTSADFISLFKRPGSMPRVSRLSQFLGR